MKKITLLFVMILATSFVFGQISLGPKIGFNTSELTTDVSEINSEMKNSFNFGVFLRLGKKIYVQPEVNWLTRGSVLKVPTLSSVSPVEQEIDMKSIEIPVLLGWRLINFGIGNVRIMAGPSASIVTNTTITTDDSNNLTDPIQDSDIEDMLWGFNIGAGVDVLMFTLDVRYQMGLNEVIKSVEEFDINSKNNIFAVSLGWKII